MKLKAPFPYFGGKSRIAAEVWRRFGDVPNYIEPFFGSGAVLLGRPTPGRWETVNDIDALLCNFWRAVKAEPDKVAELLDWPVNETDSRARHRWLCTMPGKLEFADRMQEDPDLYDVKRAAWWCWLASLWIGGGLCAGERWGPGDARNRGRDIRALRGHRPHLLGSTGVARMGLHSARTVHLRRPHLTSGSGCVCPAPFPAASTGPGQRPNLKRAQDVALAAPGQRLEFLRGWMNALAARLRDVRVCCGDWRRICGYAPTVCLATPVGVFLDPPYDLNRREQDIYNADRAGLSAEVREWALARGDDPRFRIALCGLEGEHKMPPSWECFAWTARGCIANTRKKATGSRNRFLERVWFSPHRLRPE